LAEILAGDWLFAGDCRHRWQQLAPRPAYSAGL